MWKFIVSAPVSDPDCSANAASASCVMTARFNTRSRTRGTISRLADSLALSFLARIVQRVRGHDAGNLRITPGTYAVPRIVVFASSAVNRKCFKEATCDLFGAGDGSRTHILRLCRPPPEPFGLRWPHRMRPTPASSPGNRNFDPCRISLLN